MDRLEKLKVRQLDDTLGDLKSLTKISMPDQGWVRTIRQALGMSVRQLALRTGLSKTSVLSIERSESRGSVQVDSLKKLADGLDCQLVYALIPRTSLAQFLSDQANSKARVLVNRVSDSMDLEMQGISDREKQRQIEELADELLWTKGRELWNV